MNNKEPWLAVNLSMLFPGFGQLYSGKALKGYILITIEAALIVSTVALWVQGSLGGFLTGFGGSILLVWNLFDAHSSSRSGNEDSFETSRKAGKDAWLGIFLTRILPGLGHFYMGQAVRGCAVLVLYIAMNYALVLLSGSVAGAILGLAASIAYLAAACCLLYITEKNPLRYPLLHIKYFIAGMSIVTIITFSGALLVRTYIIQAYTLPTGSMEDTLLTGDHFIMEKLSYNNVDSTDPGRGIGHGDIIVFTPPGTPVQEHVKRCIAVPGDIVSIKNGEVFLNGAKLEEPYAKGETTYSGIEAGRIEGTVPQGKIVVLGDNRRNSLDSRGFGYVPVENVTGRVILLYWNTRQILKMDFSRIGKVR
ncbi:MAG: signal peptidase I [Spirochaetes bacterium]|nr:MAG: signal peptidase I [Spirochaetota bacterium]